jgi:hypothetical protein
MSDTEQDDPIPGKSSEQSGCLIKLTINKPQREVELINKWLCQSRGEVKAEEEQGNLFIVRMRMSPASRKPTVYVAWNVKEMVLLAPGRKEGWNAMKGMKSIAF